MRAQIPAFNHLYTKNLHASWSMANSTCAQFNDICQGWLFTGKTCPETGESFGGQFKLCCISQSRETSPGCIAKTSVVSQLGVGKERLGWCCPTPSKMSKERYLGSGASEKGKLKIAHCTTYICQCRERESEHKFQVLKVHNMPACWFFCFYSPLIN